MYVHPGKRLAYLSNPKTASLSTAEALLLRGFVPVTSPAGMETAAWRASKPSRIEHHRTLSRHPGAGWNVACAVRNHWDAWLSWYFYAGRPTVRFDAAWMRGFHARFEQTYFPLPGRMWGLQEAFADTVLRYEVLESDLARWVGAPVELEVVNASGARGGRARFELYDEDAREYVASTFGAEIARFGYAFLW